MCVIFINNIIARTSLCLFFHKRNFILEHGTENELKINKIKNETRFPARTRVDIKLR